MLHRSLVAAIVLGVPICTATPANVEAQVPAPARVLASAATTGGRVQGMVRDAVGAAVVDASIVAVGATIVAARSDARGRFQMTVPPGDYVLRASREGFVSTYREPVRVRSTSQIERTITMIRQDVEVASARPPDGHAHTELAWRLRHLPRSVLRDGGAAVPVEATGDDGIAVGRPSSSFLNRAVDASSRLASALFARPDFTGHVNFVTTASASGLTAAGLAAPLPRNVAFLVLGAPLGAASDWRVRGAIASGHDASWNLLGEYESRAWSSHALRIGASYSTQDARIPLAGRLLATAVEGRSVAGVFARDHWRPGAGLEVEYGARADRYDYLPTPHLVSADALVRGRVVPATFVTAGVSQVMVAPGADEFLPPPAQGPWLPAERSFSPLNRRESFRAQQVRQAEFGIAHDFGSGDRVRTIHLRTFVQQSESQIATLFGVRDQVGLGHYHVANLGTASVAGWALGARGRVAAGISAEVEYARLRADWRHEGRTRGVRRVAPSVLRPDVDAWHDVTATLRADLNDAATRLAVVYRFSDGFSIDAPTGVPERGGRFDFQMHQALPYRVGRDGHLELLFSARTLFRDPSRGASIYDELLTVAPPLRLLGGIQVRF